MPPKKKTVKIVNKEQKEEQKIEQKQEQKEVNIPKPILKWVGGKRELIPIIREYYKNISPKKYIEPFFGGGSFEFFLQNKYNYKIIANDKFRPLYVFWKTCKHNNKELTDKLYKANKIDKSTFHKYREKIMEESDKIIQAFYYFIINRCSFSLFNQAPQFSYFNEHPWEQLEEAVESKIDSLKQDATIITGVIYNNNKRRINKNDKLKSK